MTKGTSYLPGKFPVRPAPLQRYLPPLPADAGAAWLAERAAPGAWVLDPFGVDPRLAAACARAGYRVLAAVNNPISRFLIELYAAPPTESELRAALADLASSQKSGERIENLIRSLYQTECAHCGNIIEAQAFIWERDGNAPVGKIYQCPVCKDSGERPTTIKDVERLGRSSGTGLHRARALERVVPLSDPDRSYAEEALAVYPNRAVYALLNLINHLELLPRDRQRPARLLLLAACDQTNGLWHQPPQKFRPKQLNLPPRYLEKNAWMALENAVGAWAEAFADSQEAEPLPVRIWPQQVEGPQGICLFEGRLKDLADEIQQSGQRAIEISAVVTALPRPNQAFWTLSALWSGWLWGQSASAPFKSVLRRRRYDWSWHGVALQAALSGLPALAQPGGPVFGLIGEAEPGFLSAALLAGGYSGLGLRGTAIRAGSDQAQITWTLQEPVNFRELSEEERRSLIGKEIVDTLRQRGEPAGYLHLHTAALEALLRHEALPPPDQISLAEILRTIETSIEIELRQNPHLVRLGGSSRSLEIGQWWLNEGQLAGAEIEPPLADRVEMEAVRLLQNAPGINLHAVDLALCQSFPGLFTPDLDLIQACLDSYGEPAPEEPGGWRLRSQDDPAARRNDLLEIHRLLAELGRRLGFRVEDSGPPPGMRRPLTWFSAAGEARYAFTISASAVLGKIVFAPPAAEAAARPTRRLIVLPGGRAGLVELKLRRDARLRAEVSEKWQFLKFRHVRWLTEAENLHAENLDDLLQLDPLANRDPQIPLL